MKNPSGFFINFAMFHVWRFSTSREAEQGTFLWVSLLPLQNPQTAMPSNLHALHVACTMENSRA
jgi:hypothetical protein